MTIRKRRVAVAQLPDQPDSEVGRSFLNEVEQCMDSERPHLVIDCSGVHRMDESLVYLLVCCLEAAMKRNGDVRLAGLPPGAQALLAKTRISRLFETFDTTAEAVNSFGRRPFQPVLPDMQSALSPDRESETAA